MLKKAQTKLTMQIPAQVKGLAKNLSYVFALRFAQHIISFITFFTIIHQAPKETIGEYHFVISVISLISITSLPGIRTALMQSFARKNYNFFRIATRTCTLGAAIGSLILLSLAAYYYARGEIFMAISFAIASALNPLSQGLLTWKSSHSGQENFRKITIVDAVGTLASSAFMMISVFFYTNSHLILVLIALAIPAAQNLLLCSIEYRKHASENGDFSDIKEYGLKTSFYKLLPTLAQEIDRISIYNFISPADLAIFNVASKIPNAIKGATQDVGNVLMPRFARMPNYSKKLNLYIFLFSGFTLILTALFTIYIFPTLFYIVAPQNYHSSLIYGQALLGTIAISTHTILRTSYISSQQNQKSFLAMTLIGSLAKIITAPILIFFFQTWGGVAAIFLQRIISMIGVEIIIQRYHGSN